MPKFHVSRSIVINAPAEHIYAIVRDFRTWPTWSPWLTAEPDCPLIYAEDGSSYTWDGKIIGAGENKVIDEQAPNALHLQVSFFRPWKSQSPVRFLFEPQGDGTKVTWEMDGSLPFFLFWMKAMMRGWIGMDYQRGLTMLKDLAETGEVPSSIDFIGEQPFPGFDYVGLHTRCTLDEVGPVMEKDFESLNQWLEKSGTKPSGVPFCAYQKWDFARGTAEYTIGYPVSETLTELPPDGVTGSLPDCSAYVVKHTGPYRHLGNPWSAGFMHGQAKVFAQDKRAVPFEIYENDPRNTPENDLVTLVYFPMK